MNIYDIWATCRPMLPTTLMLIPPLTMDPVDRSREVLRLTDLDSLDLEVVFHMPKKSMINPGFTCFFAKTSDLLSTCFARSWIWDCFLPLISFNHPNPWRFYHIVYYMYIILYCFKLYGKSSKSNLTSIEILKSLLEIIIQNYSNHVPSTFPTICIVWGALH